MRTQTPYAFRTSDMGGLADNSGNPFRVTADGIFTEPMGLHPDVAVIHYNSPKLSEREKKIERKPRKALQLAPIDDLQGIERAWEPPPHRSHTAGMPRSQDPINAAGHRAVTWVGAVLTVALLSAIAMGVL